MSTRENLFAFTEPSGSYPGFVSVNLLADGRVELVVRTPATPERGGETAQMELRPDQARELAHSILSGVR